MYSPMWEFFEIIEVSEGQEMMKKAVYKSCEDLQLAYGGGTSILIHHLEAYICAFGGSSSEWKTTLLSFQPKKTCSSTNRKEITKHTANTNVLVPSEEMEKYLSVAPLKSDEDTFDWCKKTKNSAKVFPTLAKLVSVCACYFSSSRKSLFNCFFVVSNQQVSLTSENVNMLIFLKKNLCWFVFHLSSKHCLCYYKVTKCFWSVF